MSDPIPGTTPVTDQRPRPRGVLPRHAQAWLMAGLAVGILGIILFTSHPAPSRRSPSATTAGTSSPDADRLRQFQERLRLADAEASRRDAESTGRSTTVSTSKGSPPPPDALAARKKQLDYESLFAGVVVSARADDSRLGGRSPLNATTASASAMPTVDEIVEAVLRASPQQRPMMTTAAASASFQSTGAPNIETSARTGNNDRPAPPSIGQYRLIEGTLIPTVLTNRLDGTSEAPVNCLVTAPVFTGDNEHLVIPAGARVLGSTKPVQTFGASRLAVSFHRLVMPDGVTYSLDRFVGLNAVGDAGLRDRVNQHYLSTFGAAGAVGLLTGLSQALGTTGLAAGAGDRTIVLAGATNEATEATARILDRFLNRAPTITIREGHRVHIYLTSDLDLPPYPSRVQRSAVTETGGR